MATALKSNYAAMSDNIARIRALERQLLESLYKSNIPYVRNGAGNMLPGLLSLPFLGTDGEAILHRMDLMGISISTGSACNSVNTEISHVLKAIKLDEVLAKGTIRISLGKNNTEDDVRAITMALAKAVCTFN
jgi:cysteine desulfurase